MTFKPPSHFNFREPRSWPSWRDNFDRFALVSQLTEKTGEIQVASLIYCMGPDADRIFSQLPLNAEQKRNYKSVKDAFDTYFTPQRNVIHERASFHRRMQKDGETIEEYVRSLYELSEFAEFADRDNQIRDRLVLGVLDKDLSEKLQLDDKLTLTSAVQVARQNELVKQQLKEQRSPGFSSADISVVRGGQGGQWHRRPQRGGRGAGGGSRGRAAHNKRGAMATARDYFQNCKFCALSHNKGQCPAFGKTCKACNQVNHFARSRVCKKQTVSEVRTTDEEPEEFYLFSVKDNYSSDAPWKVQIRLAGRDTTFKIDTGADVSVIPPAVYNSMRPRPPLQSTNTILRSPGGVLNCRGTIQVTARVKGQNFPLKVYVVDSSPECLLSRGAASSMNLVQRVSAVRQTKNTVFGELDEHPVKCKPVKILLKEDHTPYSVNTARRIPIPLLGKVKEELIKMKNSGVIAEVTEPTDWCSPIVPVIKKSGGIRICTDLKKLNLAVKRERYVIPTFEDLLHKIKGAKVFSKLDATKGFWQIPLDESTAKLTTFITPFGRYFYRRLPFGISSAPEIFQRTMEFILQDQTNVICFFDDILVFSKDEIDHEKHLQDTFTKLNNAGVKLNREKCQLKQKEIEFLGFIIGQNGIRPDPKKILAIEKMPDPTNVSELRRFLGMVNFLGRYLPNLSTILRPLSELLEKDTAWSWGPPQKKAVSTVKEMLTSAPTLAFFDPEKPTTVSADASSYGLGAVLLQEHPEGLRPVAFASRTLTKAETHYAQIEKECLASTWACEKFDRYLVGLPSFEIATDHKPLVPLMNSKDLTDTPLRCQRLLLRLMRFNLKAKHIPGKDMLVADALSRCPISTGDNRSHEEVQVHVNEIASQWPVSDARLARIRDETRKDVNLRSAMDYTVHGWPECKEDIHLAARDLFVIRNELSVHDGLLVRGTRIVIPSSMRREILERIHDGHMGVAKCRERANQSVWWPQISKQIKDRVASCRHCLEKRPTQISEPLIPSTLPDRPFQKVGIDLCEYKNKHFLVMVDYFSRYIDVAYLPSLISFTVINKLKEFFAHHGIPDIVMSDNGAQFTSAEFRSFAERWNFKHATSSPHYPQSNGAAERAVKTVKEILRQPDVFLALLCYRSTPIPELGASPAELAMGRKVRTTLPSLPSTLAPRAVNPKQVQERDELFKLKQKQRFDRHHGVQPLPELTPGDPVLIKTDDQKGWKLPGEMIEKCAPRFFLVQTPRGQLRRNRRHLKRIPRSACSPDDFRSQTPISVSYPTTDPGTPHVSPPPSPLPKPTVESSLSPLPASIREPGHQALSDQLPSTPVFTGHHTRSGRQIKRPARFLD